jgi:hypothetical protein
METSITIRVEVGQWEITCSSRLLDIGLIY